MYKYEYKNIIEGKRITDYKIIGKIGDNLIVSEGKKKGVIDINGNTILPVIYSDIIDYHDGNYIVENEKDLVGVVDSNNHYILSFGYNFIKYLGHDLYRCYTYGNMYIYNSKGKRVLFDIYPEKVIFNDDLIIVSGFEKVKFFNSNYDELKTIKGHLESDFADNRAIISKAKMLRYDIRYDRVIDNKGNTVFAKKYNNIKKIDDKYMAIDKKNNLVIIDEKGNIINELKQKAYNLSDFNNGIAMFRDNLKYGIVSADGKLIAEAIYFSINQVGNLCDLYDGNSHKIINSKGELIHMIMYNQDISLIPLSNGDYMCEDLDYIYVLNINGLKKKVFKSWFEIYNVKDNYILYDKKNNKTTLLDNNFNEIKSIPVYAKVEESDNLLIWEYFYNDSYVEKELTDIMGNVIIKNSHSDIFVINSSLILIDNKLVDLSKEYIDMKYQLLIEYKNLKFNYSFNTPKERKKFHIYFDRFLIKEIDKMEKNFINDTNNFIDSKYNKVLRK